MKHASLFSGIGGFDLAAEWMGWENVFNCEIDPFCQKVLNYHFPNAVQYHDIRTTDFTLHAGGIDVLTGGFPCQPFSLAGKRKGTEDERHLWPEMLRAVREVRPRWVVGENVFGIVNWSAGMVFEQVFSDLENEGYEVGAYILPACGVGAPHRRDRVWFVAHRADAGPQAVREGQNGVLSHGDAAHTHGTGLLPTGTGQPSTGSSGFGICRTTAYTTGFRLRGESNGTGKPGFFDQKGQDDYWQDFPTQSPVCGRNDGLSRELDGITFPAWRRESIKSYGNAVVPWVPLRIYRSIEEYEQITHKPKTE